MKTIKYLLLTCMLFLLSSTVFFANNIVSLNPDAFITTWRTTSANESIEISIKQASGGSYNFSVDWGDGNTTSGHTNNVSHTYLAPGDHIVQISGQFPQVYFLDSNTKQKLREVNQWGTQIWINMDHAFFGCINMIFTASDTPNLSNVKSMNGMFSGATKFNQQLNNWDVSKVTDMGSMFSHATSFNQPLNNWDVSKVINMSVMFSGATTFNQTLGQWNINKILYMIEMFSDAGISTINYDSTLEGWSSQNLKTNVLFHAGNSKYCDPTFKNLIINNFNWSITDGGLAPNCNYYYQDSDGDLFGNSQIGVFTYPQPQGYVLDNTDCDDTNSQINPLINEICDQIDNNCNSQIDEGVIQTYYMDADNDGYGNYGNSYSGCIQYTGYILIAEDCDDTNINVNPNSIEICDEIDNNCDGSIDEVCNTPFITTWRTTGSNQEITIPVFGPEDYAYTVDWGDGVITTGHTTNANHTYLDAGDHEVKVLGLFPRIYTVALTQAKRLRLISIDQWGSNQWTSMANAFHGCLNLNGLANDVPDLSLVTDMSLMFYGATIFNQPLDAWNVSNVQNMFGMFSGAAAFNQPIGTWDVSNVTDMSFMFFEALNFNQPIGAWNTGNLMHMKGMFNTATHFNQSIENWDVSNITDMTSVFFKAFDFNQPLHTWDVSNVTTMAFMFQLAYSFNQPLDTWDVSNVQELYSMFIDAVNFDQSLASWNLSSVTDITYMFVGATLSLENYESTLQGWSSQNLPSGLNFHGGYSQYCDPINRSVIISTYGWTFTDGGVSPACITSYRDFDNDTYGDASPPNVSISLPIGYVLNDDDCDDTNALINPASPEICDCFDNNCDGLVNNGITCAAPIAKCFTTPKVVTIGPSKLIYNGPGLKDVYRVDLNLLDNASMSLCNPIKEIARTTFPVASSSSSSSTFDWTTLGACDDILLNGNINNEDKGYSWEDCLPVTIGGDNNKIRTYKLKVADIFGTSTCSGSYKVVYSSSASPEVIDIDKYGLTEVELNDNLIVYPNPSFSELNILIDVNIEKLSTYSLLIYDVLGKEVNRLNDLNSGVIKVNTESLNAGTYNIVVKSGDDVFTKRWVKI